MQRATLQRATFAFPLLNRHIRKLQRGGDRVKISERLLIGSEI